MNKVISSFRSLRSLIALAQSACSELIYLFTSSLIYFLIMYYFSRFLNPKFVWFYQKLIFLFDPAPEFLSSHCSLRNSIPACLGLFGYPVPLVRYANSICYRSLRNYGCYEFRFASLYRKSASRGGEFSLRSSGWHELKGLSKKQKADIMKKSNCPLIKVNKWRSK